MEARGETSVDALPLAARDALAGILVRALREPAARAALAGALAFARLAPGARATAIDRETGAALLAVGLAEPAVPVGGGPPCAEAEREMALVRARPAWEPAAVERLETYSRVATRVGVSTSLAGALEQARVLFAHDLAFEVHEVLEPVWRQERGETRLRLQGVIQAAVARYHAGRGGRGPAQRLARSALVKLAAAPGRWEGFPLRELEVRTRMLAEHLARDDGAPLPAPPFGPGDEGMRPRGAARSPRRP